MRVIKYTHSCIRVEKNDRALVIDPGSFSEEEPLDGADAVLVTHEHPDHLDAGKLERHPTAEIWTNASTAAKLTGIDPQRVHVVAGGDAFSAAGFEVGVYGELHEVIHPDIPPVPNIGFLLDDGAFFHPGDAFTVPDRPVRTVVVPISAPWLRAADSVDYIRALRPDIALSGHDGILNEIGLGILDGLLTTMADKAGSHYRRLASGHSVEV